jgi:hypothetical protein
MDLDQYPNDLDKWAERFKTLLPTVNTKIADTEYLDFNKNIFLNVNSLK